LNDMKGFLDMVLKATFYNSKHDHFLPKSINSNH